MDGVRSRLLIIARIQYAAERTSVAASREAIFCRRQISEGEICGAPFVTLLARKKGSKKERKQEGRKSSLCFEPPTPTSSHCIPYSMNVARAETSEHNTKIYIVENILLLRQVQLQNLQVQGVLAEQMEKCPSCRNYQLSRTCL